MKARALIGGASYDPERLKILYTAFDDAWEQVAPGVGTRPEAIEAARTNLAYAIMGLASDGSEWDTARLTSAALEAILKPTAATGGER